MEFSVLMSCYKNDNPDFLKIAIESSFTKQTLLPNEFVLVIDGPISKNLEDIIVDFVTRYPDIFKVHQIAENKGLGNALREGVQICSNKYIIRMDSDDVSRVDRFEKLINFAKEHQDFSVIGSYTAEFENNIECITSVREVKQNHKEILKQAKTKSPVSHVSVLLKKDAVLAAGNYLDFPLYEDYYLWIRMLKKNFIFYNIPEVLVYVRTDSNRYKRKGNKTYVKSTVNFQNYLKSEGIVNTREYLINKYGRLFVALIPSSLRRFIYINILRRKPKVS